MSVLKIDNSWTLFLDRDGVINQRISGQYISKVEKFVFTDGCLEAISYFSTVFSKLIIVTNQQGIAKGIMTEKELNIVHENMLWKIEQMNGKIDGIYFCPELSIHNPSCRKPNTGMAMMAQKDFPSIVFEKSIMVGDSISDILFGNALGMKTVFVAGKAEDYEKSLSIDIDLRISKLSDLADCLEIEK